MQAQGQFSWGALSDYSVRSLMSVTRRELVRTRRLSLDFQLPLPPEFRVNLVAYQNKLFIPLPLGVPSQFLNIMTDASGVGWGIKLSRSQFSGRFDASLLQADIALKELLTVFGLCL